MSTHYNHAPLVEVIAEVRWPTPEEAIFQAAPPNALVNIPQELISASEVFYSKFAELADNLDFRNTERLSPQNSGSLPGQPVVRYRKKLNAPPLMQIGAGVFTVNGLPPTYVDWDDFAPMLSSGMSALQTARVSSGLDGPFSRLILRYINAFDATYWQERTPGQFIRDVLGFDVKMPSSAEVMYDPSTPGSMLMQRSVPMRDGGLLNFNVGEGLSNGDQAVVLEMAVEYAGVAADEYESVFDTAHRILADLFEEMVRDITPLLEPTEAS